MRFYGTRPVLGIASVVIACAAVMPACRSGSHAVSTDPAQPIFRSATADFSKVQGVALHFTSVTTNTNEGTDLLKEVFLDSLRTHLSPKFGSVTEGATAPAGGAVMEVSLRVNWGSRAARAMVGFGAGRAGIEIKYDLKDASGAPLAKLHTTDTMSGGAFGGDAKGLVFAAADKWNRHFAQVVLVNAPPAGR